MPRQTPRPVPKTTSRKLAAVVDADLDTRDARLLKVARMYCQGRTQRDIAEAVGVSQPMVCADLKLIRQAWVEDQNVSFGEAKAKEVAKIDHLEAVAWESWFRSCRDSEVKTRKTERVLRPAPKVDARKLPNGKMPEVKETSPPGKDGLTAVKVVSERKLTGQTGNPAYLDQVAWCIETRVKILGLIKDTVVNNFINWDAVAAAALAVPEDVDPIEQRILGVKGGK